MNAKWIRMCKRKKNKLNNFFDRTPSLLGDFTLKNIQYYL